MDTFVLVNLAAILGLLVLSAFFSGSETSITAASRARMHTLEQQGDMRAKTIQQLWERKERMIGAILLGNNLVNILASALATSVLISLFGEAGVAYATIGMTFLVLVFAEILPKTYALLHPDRTALRVSRILRVVVTVFGPIVQMIEGVVGTILSVLRLRPDEGDGAWEEELRGAIDLHTGPDEETKHEREMLRSILDLDDVAVEEIMTHRRDVEAIDVAQPPRKIVEEALASPYTRLPLYREQPDEIVGVLHAKALLRAVQASPDAVDTLDVQAIANPPWFIPDTTDLLSQLQAFRQRKEHFAIVVDEYGELRGVVTLEDILEEIVGDISDEHDVDVEGLELQPDGTAVVEGKVTIRDINRRCEWRLPDDEASTIAGLVLHEARRIPAVGQRFAFHGFSFEILERQRNQITLVKVSKLDTPGVQDTAELEEA